MSLPPLRAMKPSSGSRKSKGADARWLHLCLSAAQDFFA
jgi:hypothetical protein